MAAPEGLGSSFESTIQRAVDGESTAFDAMYRSYSGRIRSFAAARGAVDADAVANDVMMRCFQHLSSFRGAEDAFVRWLFTIARNRLIDLHRRSTRRPSIVDQAVPETVAPSAEVVALDNLSVEQVHALLGVLTVDQREVIALRLVDDLSLADVAEIVGRSITAVKGLQRRGLQRLQREILAGPVS